MASAMFIDSKCPEGREGRGEDALDHVRSGGVVVFRNCLSDIGYEDRLRQSTLDEMRLHCDAAKVQKIESGGFEKVHEILSAEEIFDVNVGLTERMKLDIGHFIGAFADKILGFKRRVFIYGLPVVRFFVPHDVFAANRSLFSKRQGFLQIQGPHHDTWFDHATESLNVWIAIGRVRRGNGLIIYTDHGQNYVEHDGARGMPKDQSLGRSISFDLDPGDVIFFHGETLHSSELNATDETRYVVTNRFTLNKPRFKEHEQWQDWYDSSLLGTALERLAIWPTYLSRDYLLHKLKRNVISRVVTKVKKRLIPSRDVGKATTRPAPAETESAAPDLQGVRVLSSFDDMAVGEIRAASRSQCVLKSEKGLVAFSRFCPHEGADLANASYEDGRIQCPWHHLSFDPQTGEQPCRSLKNLKVVPLTGPVVNAEPPKDGASGGLTESAIRLV